MRHKWLILGLAALAVAASPARAAPPQVVASIKPLHSLIAGIMAGVGTPTLIVNGAASPHTYALRPSDARALAAAKLVFWIGPSMESFLVKPLAALSGGAEIVELDHAAGVTVLRAREGGVWEPDADAPPPAGADTIDGHLWLDIGNARAIVRVAASRLEALDPANAERYGANTREIDARLDALDQEMRADFFSLAGRPFVVFHDAYQYLEHRYALDIVGAISVDPDRPIGARRIAEIRAKLVSSGAHCVYGEPQFTPALLATVTDGTGARAGTLDDLGTGLPDGPGLYFSLMRNIAGALSDCLAR
jgi:zinc transport system substrate-binding protein